MVIKLIQINNKSDCCGCSACASVCPVSCIEMRQDEEGFFFPHVDAACCVNCGACEKVCFIHSPVARAYKKPRAFVAYNTDDAIRYESSSGGMFSLFASAIIEQGGIVFGAAFSDDCHSVQHIGVESIEELHKLRQSKYMESFIGNTYKEAKEALESGRQVLFSGTPCQIEGLKAFLGKDYDNLWTIDLLCYGMPSQKVWNVYLNKREKTLGSDVQEAYHRNKRIGWGSFYCLHLCFKNDKHYFIRGDKDTYLKAFNSGICHRDVCNSCPVKRLDRVSDITIGDAWGYQEYTMTEMNDGKGLSLVLVHSSRGQKFFDSLSSQMKASEVDPFISAVKNNSATTPSFKKKGRREEFYSNLGKEDFDHLVNRLTHVPLPIRGFRFAKRVGKHIARKFNWM